MKRIHWIALLLLLFMGFLLYMIFSPESGPRELTSVEKAFIEKYTSEKGVEIDEAELNQELESQVREVFADVNWPDYGELMEAIRTGKINLIWELWNLRRKCPKSMTPERCDYLIRLLIKKKYSGLAQERLLKLFDLYINYEKTLRDLKLPSNQKEAYEILKAKQDEIFGAEDAALLFGYDRAKFEFVQKGKEFLSSTKGLTAEERLREYDRLQKEIYGDYYETVKDREPKFDRYQLEMKFTEEDPRFAGKSLPPEKKRKLREKYFGVEGARRMAEVDKQLEAQKQAEAQVASEEAKFQAAHPDLQGEALEAELMKIRLKYMSKEEAEAYTRRRNYKLYLQNKK